MNECLSELDVKRKGEKKNTRRHIVPAGNKTLPEKNDRKRGSYQKAAVTDRNRSFLIRPPAAVHHGDKLQSVLFENLILLVIFFFFFKYIVV